MNRLCYDDRPRLDGIQEGQRVIRAWRTGSKYQVPHSLSHGQHNQTMEIFPGGGFSPRFQSSPLTLVLADSFANTMASATSAGPSAVAPASTLSLLTNIPITHPSFLPLLTCHAPLASASTLSSSSLNKLLGRINSALLAKDNEVERRAAFIISTEVLRQDAEGYALVQWGKGWVTAALAALTVSFAGRVGIER